MSELLGLELPDGQGTVWFETEPADGWVPAGSGDGIVGRLDDALQPLIVGARMMVERVRELGPDEVEVEFGAKLAGETGWVFAKATTEGSVKVTLKWKSDRAEHTANGRTG